METDPRFVRDSVFNASEGVSSIEIVLDRLGVTKPTVVMVIIGGAKGMIGEIALKVRALFERSLAPILESRGVVVVTGGTDAGVMAIVGETLSSVATLVGVTPRGALEADTSVDLQPAHHLHVLTPGAVWGSETNYMVRLAKELTQGERCGVVLLVNGGSIAVEETNYFVDAGWPILAVAGSGGAADDLISLKTAWRTRGPKYRWGSLKNVDLDRVDLTGPPRDARKRFHWYASRDELLKSAWTYY